MQQQHPQRTEVAILIPCLNEEKTIAKVVSDFKKELPDAKVYVFDNISTDRTAQLAIQAGAEVFYETRRGKGAVIQAMFQKIEADIYVMVDGDDTYPASKVFGIILKHRPGVSHFEETGNLRKAQMG
jgi:glycosyltransferase involved in cell wall biosynthesis